MRTRRPAHASSRDPADDQHGRERDGGEHPDPHRQVESGAGGELLGEDAELGYQADLQRQVGDDHDARRAGGGTGAESARDVRDEAPGVGDVPAHLEVADREDCDDPGDQQVDRGSPGADKREHDGGGTDEGRHGRGGGDHEEGDADDTETVPLQRGGVLGRGGLGGDCGQGVLL